MVPSFIVGTGRGNNFQHVLGEGGICPPIRRRALNGFLAGAVKRIKTRTDDEGGGSSLPKIRLCIKVPLYKFTAAQWYLTLFTCFARTNLPNSTFFHLFFFFFFFHRKIYNLSTTRIVTSLFKNNLSSDLLIIAT